MNATTFNPLPASSPAPSSSSSSGSRKRPRLSTDQGGPTSEEKREARAQRNRQAAQESRDRRKREFGELHGRVAQLEAENAALREAQQNKTTIGLGPVSTTGDERTERLERENAELLERVTRLEAALTSVMPLIQGSRPSSVVPGLTSTTPSSPSHTTTPSFPSVFVAPPAIESSALESTRHLARVATVPSPLLDVKVTPQQRVDSSSAMISHPPTVARIPQRQTIPSPTTTHPSSPPKTSSTASHLPHHPPLPSPPSTIVPRPTFGFTPWSKAQLATRRHPLHPMTRSWAVIVPPRHSTRKRPLRLTLRRPRR